MSYGKGKGHGRSSVADHRFGTSAPLTLGVEEEYMLVDAETFELRDGVDAMLSEASSASWSDRVTPELFSCSIETGTGVCATVADVERDLREVRTGLAAAAAAHGLRVAASAAHPFSLSETQRISPRDRYRFLIEQLQYVARRELVFGMHVHVGMPDPDTCIEVMEAVVAELPVILALSANSPFWRGRDSGLASTRTAVFAGFPRSGLPPPFPDYEAYHDLVVWLESTAAIGEYTHIWWDVRPHPRLGTLEIRVADVQFDLDSTLALTAYMQAFVAAALAGDPAVATPSVPRMVLAENKWLAARHGAEAPLIDVGSNLRRRMRAEQLARRRMRQLKPHARTLGCAEALGGIEKILEIGTGAHRQRRVVLANEDLVEMLRELADVTELRT